MSWQCWKAQTGCPVTRLFLPSTRETGPFEPNHLLEQVSLFRGRAQVAGNGVAREDLPQSRLLDLVERGCIVQLQEAAQAGRKRPAMQELQALDQPSRNARDGATGEAVERSLKG